MIRNRLANLMNRLTQGIVLSALLEPAWRALEGVRGAERASPVLDMKRFITLWVLRHLQGVETLREQVQEPLHLAQSPVPGYAEEALRRGADLAEQLGHSAPRDAWRARAASLRERLQSRFWVDDIGSFALALDGRGRPCAARTSNPAHLLCTGSIGLALAKRLASQLDSPDACNGWGLRTVFAGEPRYNPMSYPNGSVWPHDTALAAAGLAQYGFADAYMRDRRAAFGFRAKAHQRLCTLDR
jgi:hypothetical protein